MRQISVPGKKASIADVDSPSFRILVVEDDLGVLKLLKIVLAYYGFEVVAVPDGDQAIEMYRRHHRTISLVLLDVQMAPLDGPQTLAALQRINAEVCCCFMSASTGQYQAEQLLAMGAACVIGKPFRSLTELAEVLRSVMKVAR